MTMLKNVLLLIVGLLTVLDVTGQRESEQTIWLQTSEQVQLTQRVTALLLYQRRVFLNREDTYQNLYWLSAGYKIRNTSLGGGFMYFKYHRQLASVHRAVPEIRPFQYVSYIHTKKDWTLGLRAMVEERYLSSVHENQIEELDHLEIRGRLRTNSSYQFNARFSLLVGNEVFFPREHGFVQNRFSAEVGVKLRPVKLSFGYMNWYLDELPVRHSWLLRFHHRFHFPLK